MPHPANEPILGYEPGSQERESLQSEIDRQMAEIIEIPCIINGEEVYTGVTVPQVIPHNHGHVLANVHLAGRDEMEAACAAAVAAQQEQHIPRHHVLQFSDVYSVFQCTQSAEHKNPDQQTCVWNAQDHVSTYTYP